MSSTSIQLGAKIREYRKKRGLTLIQVSEITGIAASTLSAFELDKSSPTLGTLVKIAEAFGVRPGRLLDEIMYPEVTVFREKDPSGLETKDDGCTVRVLTRDAPVANLDGRVLTIPSGTTHAPAEGQEKERLVYCLSGNVHARVGEEQFVLGPGDCLHILCGPKLTLESREDPHAGVLVTQSPASRE